MIDKLQNLTSTAIKVGVPSKWLKEKAIANEVPCLIINGRLLFNIEAVKERLLQLASNVEGVHGD